jgi:hypothetical protein
VEGEDGLLVIARSGVWVFWKIICLVGNRSARLYYVQIYVSRRLRIYSRLRLDKSFRSKGPFSLNKDISLYLELSSFMSYSRDSSVGSVKSFSPHTVTKQVDPIILPMFVYLHPSDSFRSPPPSGVDP